MGDLFKVSQSKVKTFRMCRRAYHFRYVENLKKAIKSRPLTFGTIIHEMLDAFANGLDPYAVLKKIARVNKKLFADEREMYGEIVDDIKTIMDAYFKYYTKKSLRFIKYKGSAAEHSLEVELDNDFLFVFRVDHFGKTENGLRWLVENKTFSKQPSEDQRWIDLQTSMYIRACEMLGIKHLNGVCWNYIKSKAPTRPEVVQKGTRLSIRSIDTLPATVRAVIKAHKLKESACKANIKQATENIPSYFSRVFNPVTPQVVDTLFNEFQETCIDIRDQHGEVIDRNLGQHCSWCDFNAICRTELTGGDTDYIREHEYVCRSKEKAKSKKKQK